MSLTHHSMPRDLFTALARGGGGLAGAGDLAAAQYSKHVILLRSVAKAARPTERPDDRLAVAGSRLLAEAQRRDPAAASAVIGYPSVGAWALRTVRGDQDPPGALPGGLAAVAAAAAIRAGLEAEIEVPVHGGAVILPSLGAATARGRTAVVRTNPAQVRSGELRVDVRPGAVGWQDLRDIQAGSLHAVLDDVDPFRMPATDGEPTGRLTRAQASEMTAMLRAAWTVLPPVSAAEISALIRVIVPYRAPDAGVVSTSSPEAFGTVALSRQPDEYTCAETLVHEGHHLKLGALLDLVRLTQPDDGQRYYAPWRADPRPASALLQGAYAFLGVSGFWRWQRRRAPDPAVRRRADAEFAHWREGAALVTDTLLASGQLTIDGHDFVTEMATVLARWRQEPVAPESLAVARRKADRHRAQFRAENGNAATGSGEA